MSRHGKSVPFVQRRPTTCLIHRKTKRKSRLGVLFGVSPDNWAVIANAFTALSFFLAFIGLCFAGWQIREQRKSRSFEGNFEIMRQIVVQFDIFCKKKKSESRIRELVNLLKLFEYISYTLNKRLASRRDFKLVEAQVVDLIEKIVDIKDCFETIKCYRTKPDIYSEITTLVIRNRTRFSNFNLVAEAFNIDPATKFELQW